MTNRRYSPAGALRRFECTGGRRFKSSGLPCCKHPFDGCRSSSSLLSCVIKRVKGLEARLLHVVLRGYRCKASPSNAGHCRQVWCLCGVLSTTDSIGKRCGSRNALFSSNTTNQTQISFLPGIMCCLRAHHHAYRDHFSMRLPNIFREAPIREFVKPVLRRGKCVSFATL